MSHMQTDWNMAEIFEAIAAKVPDRPCQVHADDVVSWSAFDRRADGLAADLLNAGLRQQSVVALYLYNGPQYLEAMHGCFKVSMIPLNVNFRYGPDEVGYLFHDASVEAVVFDTRFLDVVEEVRRTHPEVRRWYSVGPGGPEWALSYSETVAASAGRVTASWPRSGNDLLLLYTGGTTGLPKGVMWRQDDIVNALGAGGHVGRGIPPATDVDELAHRADAPDPAVRVVACPLMHGAGLMTAIVTMMAGGTIVTLVGRTFDPAEVFEAAERHRATAISIVGQAFAGPMLEHLDCDDVQYNLDSLATISSSGVMWNEENKAGLLRHLPNVLLYDAYGSSEAIGAGRSISSTSNKKPTARFELGPNCAVFTEDGRRVAPGSDEIGRVAIGGFIPVGYYNDPVKTAQTFPVIEGHRWSIPGDFASVDADGTIRLLGRGSSCINTGGEKVFAEEVEEAVKTHESVRDAVVVGVPDDRFGEAVCAVVEAIPGTTPSLTDLSGHVKETLASFKAPQHLVLVESIGRATNGKVDMASLRDLAKQRIATAVS